jgi:hypothetical protein
MARVHMHDLALDGAADKQDRAEPPDASVPLERVAPHDEVRDAGLIFEVMNVTPEAVPGRCRQSTSPQRDTADASTGTFVAQLAAGDHRRFVETGRRNDTGCALSDSPCSRNREHAVATGETGQPIEPGLVCGVVRSNSGIGSSRSGLICHSARWRSRPIEPNASASARLAERASRRPRSHATATRRSRIASVPRFDAASAILRPVRLRASPLASRMPQPQRFSQSPFRSSSPSRCGSHRSGARRRRAPGRRG